MYAQWLATPLSEFARTTSESAGISTAISVLDLIQYPSEVGSCFVNILLLGRADSYVRSVSFVGAVHVIYTLPMEVGFSWVRPSRSGEVAL